MPLDDAELEHWRTALEERRDWLESRGTRYLLFMAPDKHGLYPEMLPDSLRRDGVLSRYEQWYPYVSENSDVAIVDLYGPLRKAMAGGHLTYFPLGTHWTIPGAFVGTRAVLERVARWFPAVEVPSWDDFSIVSTDDHPGDSWGGKLLIEDLLSQPVVGLERHEPLPFRRVDASEVAARHGVLVTITMHEDQSLPTAVMFHDSFAPAMMDFLSCHFSRVVYYWSPVFKPGIVLEESPDVVLHERVERFLAYLPPRLPAPQKRELERARGRGEKPVNPGKTTSVGKYFNPGLGEIEILVGETTRIVVDGVERPAEARSTRVYVDGGGDVYTIAAGGGETLTVQANGAEPMTAYRSVRSDATHDLRRFEGDFEGGGIDFNVRVLDGRLVVFAVNGAQTSVLTGNGPAFAVIDKPGVFVEFVGDGERMQLQITKSERLEARRIEGR